MENVTDALYMGFAALVFVLALSICIGAFSQVTAVSQYIVDTRDRETSYSYVDYDSSDTNRIVSAETIVPTLYRIYDENCIVRFDFKAPMADNILEITRSGKTEKTNKVDLRKTLGTGSREAADEYITALLNGTVNSNPKFKVSTKYLQSEKLYDIIKKRKFEEKIGIYYEDDLKENNIDDVNKTEVRLITYTEQ